MVNYANGPLYLSAAYETAKHLVPGSGVDFDLRSWKLGAGYSFGNFTVNGIYEDIKGTLNSGLTFLGTPFTAGADAKRKAYGLNGVYNMGNIALKAGYYHASKIDTSAGSVNDSAAKMYELGADYNLSKRTKAYLVYTKVKDDTAASYCAGGSNSAGFGSSGVNIVCGDDPSILALGMRHTF
jgi:predicted porin